MSEIETRLNDKWVGVDGTTWAGFTVTVRSGRRAIKYGAEAAMRGDKISVFRIYRQGGQSLRRDAALRVQISDAVKAHLLG